MKSGLFNKEALEKDCPSGFVKVVEGSTAVLFPPALQDHQHPRRRSSSHENTNLKEEDGGEGGSDDQAVFYNPAQVVNRDLSICAIEVFAQNRTREPPRKGGTKRGITILEALSATGLRAIRYYKEISHVRYIIANDLDGDAVDCIARNCAYNAVPVAYPTLSENFDEGKEIVYAYEEEATGAGEATARKVKEIVRGGAIIPNKDDANDLMARLAMNRETHNGARMALYPPTTENNNNNSSSSTVATPLLQQELVDVVDLDPYGTVSPFLDNAFRCVKEGGLMLLTSTDSPILCGNFPDTCHAKYNSISYKGDHCHEMAVRLLLAAVERVANKHKKYVVPLLSCHIDFYVRCFLRVYTQPAETKLSVTKLGYQLQCTQCPAFWVRPMARARVPEKKQVTSPSHSHKRGRLAEGEEGGEATAASAHPVTASADVPPPPPECYPATADRARQPKVTAALLDQLLLQRDGAAVPLPAPGCCPVCGSAVTISGPLYAAPTQHRPFLVELLACIEAREAAGQLNAYGRVKGLVQTALEELPHAPLFYDLPELASYVRARCPPTPYFVGALGRLGYRCSQVHCAPAGLKTDCPPDVLVRVMLTWKEKARLEEAQKNADHSNKEEGQAKEASTATKSEKQQQQRKRCLLTPLPLEKVDFSYDKQYDYRRQATGLCKFVPNAPGWGPKRRHQGAQHVEDEEEQ